MSVCVTPLKPPFVNNGPRMFVKGAPESVLERCSFVRVDGQTVPITPGLRGDIIASVNEYALGRDSLRCLALATVDSPRQHMDVKDPGRFAKYEVRV